MERARETQALVAGRGQHFQQVNPVQREGSRARQINAWN